MRCEGYRHRPGVAAVQVKTDNPRRTVLHFRAVGDQQKLRLRYLTFLLQKRAYPGYRRPVYYTSIRWMCAQCKPLISLVSGSFIDIRCTYVSRLASTSSMMYRGDGKQSCTARRRDKLHAACCPPDSWLACDNIYTERRREQ
jgi:hypothetical protein